MPQTTVFAPPQGDTDPREVICWQDGPLGRIRLNRPRALNALSLAMIRDLRPALRGWAADAAIKAVVIEGAGDKAFCAGGDVRAVYDAGRDGALTPGAKGEIPADFFREEYVLNHTIHRFPKPYIAVVDGISMGGGVGLSIHGSHRVVTDRTLFAMPETGIGLFPDVGGGWYLAQAPGETGVYAGLTGYRGRAADAMFLGYGTHYLTGDALARLVAALGDADWGGDAFAAADQVLDGLASDGGPAPLAALATDIGLHFDFDTVEGIVESLRAADTAFAAETLKALSGLSPTSLKVTLRQIRAYRPLSYDEAVTIDYRLSQACMAGHDFYEGIRALLVDKDKSPKWRPATLEEVTPEIIDRHFAPLGDRDLIVPEA